MIVEIYTTARSGHEEATAVKVAVVGAGDSGKAIKRALQATGAQVTLHSRRTGFDVLHDDGAAALSGADVIVEATGREPDLPERFAGIMSAPRHVTDMPNDAAVVKDFIRRTVAG
mgnify:CR=1 FL=1